MNDDEFRRMLAEIEAREAEMFQRMESAEPVEAVGVVESIVGFGGGGGGEPSMSIELCPWRWVGGPIERGKLYVRKPAIAEGELRKMRNTLPEWSVTRLHVRPDVCRRETGDLWDAKFEAIVQGAVADEELEALASKLREQQEPVKLGKPEFDFWWWFFDLLARLLPEPTLPIVQIGLPRPEGNWWPETEKSIFEGCEEWFWNTGEGTIRVAVLNETVEGVMYDLETYRRSGMHCMKKLQTLLKAHSLRNERIYRILDNHHGAMMYRTTSNSRFAIYFYNVDMFLIHSDKTAHRSR